MLQILLGPDRGHPREGQGASRATLALLSPPLRWEDETGWPCHCWPRAPSVPYEAAGGEVFFKILSTVMCLPTSLSTFE